LKSNLSRLSTILLKIVINCKTYYVCGILNKYMKSTLKLTLALIASPFLFQSCCPETVTPSKAVKQEVSGSQEGMNYTCNTKCYQEETAWSTGCDYSKSGWATYTKYNAYSCVAVYAGQNNYAGSVHFSCVNNGKVTITITLCDGWELADDAESVKIQGYSSAPSGKPAPGKFTTYKGNELTIEVDAACFYGIHLDVRKEVACN
jgi:hypothetical protein